MTAVKHQTLRRQLEALKDRLRPEVSAITEQTRAPAGGQAANELSNAPFHLGDTGTEEYLHDLNATLLENAEYLANEVQDALRRFDDGTYGRCESCGRAIAEARLQAIPYTRYCIKCAGVANAAPDVNLNSGRPQTPDDTFAPETEMEDYRGRDPEITFADQEVDAQKSPSRGRADVHAAGTPGGGGSAGGLAGTNEGHGDPDLDELEEAMGSGSFDMTDARDNDPDEPKSGPSGGAVGGTPANKRAR